MLDKVHIVARDLPDAWFQCVFSILEKGKEFTIDKGSFAGSKRLEFDWIEIHILNPQTRPLLPDIPSQYNIPNPVSLDYLDEYVSYIMTSDKKPKEDYTYGERLTDIKIVRRKYDETGYMSQVEHVIETYKKYGHRNNQMVLQIAQPSDILLGDPPCLRHIDTRIQDNKLHFFIYFRSWDLWAGLPANLAGILYLQEYMASEIGVKCGEFICTSKGLHLYDYVVPFAKIRCMKENKC